MMWWSDAAGLIVALICEQTDGWPVWFIYLCGRCEVETSALPQRNYVLTKDSFFNYFSVFICLFVFGCDCISWDVFL
jgi:hypothetical protein